MIRYVIALSELGIKNNNLIFLLQSYSSDIEKMFTDSSVFEERLEFMAYKEYFSDKNKVDEVLLKADTILEKNKEFNIKVTFYTDKNYPKELKKQITHQRLFIIKGQNFLRYQNTLLLVSEPENLQNFHIML